MANWIITRMSSDELMHFGIKGQKWGVRRFENEDGTLTPEGKLRYREAEKKAEKYKSVGNRIAKVIGGGIAGAASMGSILTAVLASGGSAAFGEVGLAGAVAAAPLLAATALGGAGITALVQGVHAAKVRRGMNFLNKYGTAHKKTVKQEFDIGD